MPEYTRSTNKIHKIVLTSKITHALWNRQSAGPGGKVAFEIRTIFVGNNSDIEVKVKNKSKTVETIKGKVYGNIFKSSIIVPKKAKEEMSYEINLPKHKLKMKSEILKIIPQYHISDVKWGQDEASRGDLVSLTASTEGIMDDEKVSLSIYEHDTDGAHDLVTSFHTRINKNKIEAEWEFKYYKDVENIATDWEVKPLGRDYKHPEYFFIIRYCDTEEKSALLRFKD